MSAENNIGRTESARGGCLDAFVGAVTLGRYGVETTATYPAQVIKPTGHPLEDGETNPAILALRTGQTVMLTNFEKANQPQISRHIVKNQRLG